MWLLVYVTLLGSFLYVLLMPLVLIDLLVQHFRDGSSRRQLTIASISLAGFVTGTTAAWITALRRGWTLSFFTTMRASVDSATWGHEIEHQAENLMMAVLLFSLIGAIVAAASSFCVMRTRRSVL